MARIRPSFLERGQAVSGHTYEDGAPAQERGESAEPVIPPRSFLRLGGRPATRAAGDGGHRPPLRQPDIEKALDNEAEAALGRDGAVPSAVPAAERELGPLPAIEWIVPVPSPESSSELPASSGPVADAPGALPSQPAGAAPVISPAPDSVVQPDRPQPITERTPAPGTVAEIPADSRWRVPLTPEQQAELLKRPEVQARLAELNQLIQAQYDRIRHSGVSSNQEITDWCDALLAEARAIVLYQQVDELARAEWCVEQVRSRLERAEKSDRQVVWPVLIMLWGMAWFGLFVYSLFDPIWVLAQLELASFSDTFIVPAVFVRALYFGGIGGVAAVFYHLFKYVRERSFDTRHLLSYFGKPFMGMILGSMVYLTVFVAMRVLGLTPIGVPGSDSEAITHILYTGLLFFVAMAAGFKENLVFGLLNRVIKRIFGEDAFRQAPDDTC